MAYELYLSTPLGVRLAVLDNFESLQWARALNAVGPLRLIFGAQQVDWRLWGLDRRVEVWRAGAGISRLVGIWYLRSIERWVDEQGIERIGWGAEDANGLLARRVIAWDAGTTQAEKTDFADDMLKELVAENLGSGAGAGRDLTAYGLTIDADHGSAPSVTCECARQGLLAVLQSVAQASRDLGTRLYFEIMHPTMTTLQFRTYVHRLGQDRTTLQSPFSLLRGTLAPPVRILRDHGDEVNVVYAAGEGAEEDREVVAVSDVPATNASPFARREAVVDGRSYEGTASLTAFGSAKLQFMKVRPRFEATLQDIDGSRYLADWALGDLVSAEYDAEIYDCEVSAVQGTATRDSETITARLASYE
jgi:hypothetical protein